MRNHPKKNEKRKNNFKCQIQLIFNGTKIQPKYCKYIHGYKKNKANINNEVRNNKTYNHDISDNNFMIQLLYKR